MLMNEGSYNYDTSEAKRAIQDVRDKGYDEIADILSRAWMLHDKLGEQAKDVEAHKKGGESKYTADDMYSSADKLVNVLVRTLKPRLQQQDLLTDYVDEEIGNAKGALDVAESPRDISLLVQRPAHNAIEGVVEKILDKQLN